MVLEDEGNLTIVQTYSSACAAMEYIVHWTRLTMPTFEQCLSCFLVCTNLTRFLQPIFLIRLDQRTGNIVILAGQTLQIEIRPNGERDYDESA